MITISTTDYEFAHGKKPRGKGYWGFKFSGVGIFVRTEFAVGELSFSEARRWALARAKAINCSYVSVAT